MDVKEGGSVLSIDGCGKRERAGAIWDSERGGERRRRNYVQRNCLFFTGVTVGGIPACYIIEHQLSRFVEGQVSMN